MVEYQIESAAERKKNITTYIQKVWNAQNEK